MKIENCYNEGEIGSSKNYEKYEVIGGVIGQAWDSKDINCYDITINNCKNKGEVSGYRYIGGIVGILDNCNINIHIILKSKRHLFSCRRNNWI